MLVGGLMADVGKLSFEQKLGEVLNKTADKVGPEVGAQLRALVEPKSLGVMAGVLVVWVVGHGLGYGEAVDLVIGIVGYAALGWGIFTGLDEVYEFAKTTYYAHSGGDIDAAADHLAKAISILGVQAVLAILFHGRPKTKSANPGPAPPKTPGRRYSPSTNIDPALTVGRAYCSWWGDIYVNAISTGDEAAMLLFHERVHQFLTPKLYFLRDLRLGMRVGSYAESSLFRWLEEWLAYAVGYGRVKNWSAMFGSIGFPVQRGYVYWLKAGSNPALAIWGGRGVIPEGSGLIAAGLMLGERMQLWLKPGGTAVPAPSGAEPRKPELVK